jgi:hypothetical protein
MDKGVNPPGSGQNQCHRLGDVIDGVSAQPGATRVFIVTIVGCHYSTPNGAKRKLLSLIRPPSSILKGIA